MMADKDINEYTEGEYMMKDYKLALEIKDADPQLEYEMRAARNEGCL